MKNKKTSTFVYEGLGIPVKLINVPMKKMLGEWFIDVNMETLQKVVLEALVHKPFSLTGAELRYMPGITWKCPVLILERLLALAMWLL